MADSLGPILPLPGLEPALPTDGALSGDETTAGETQPSADPPGRGTATGTDPTAEHLQTDGGAASDTGHNWNMDPPGSAVDTTVRDA
ncbi:MAG: hypothetical protein M3Z04_04140 [Chloroflexota bacterium]|nr:hypothetical protein [Chloroflexota bacterium]